MERHFLSKTKLKCHPTLSKLTYIGLRYHSFIDFYKLTDFYCSKICIFMTVKTFLADKLKILILQWYRYAMCHYAVCDSTEYHGNLLICFVVQCPTNHPSNYFVKKTHNLKLNMKTFESEF